MTLIILQLMSETLQMTTNAKDLMKIIAKHKRLDVKHAKLDVNNA